MNYIITEETLLFQKRAGIITEVEFIKKTTIDKFINLLFFDLWLSKNKQK